MSYFALSKYQQSMGDADDIDDWPTSSLGKKLSKLEETLQCPICFEIYTNPHNLSCGHTYCSPCIRRHLDKAFNPSNTSDSCPLVRILDTCLYQIYTWNKHSRTVSEMIKLSLYCSAKSRARYLI